MIKSLKQIKARINETLTRDWHLIGESQAFAKVLEQCGSVAPHDTTILLCGETGTGKEICARAIHAFGPYAAGPFIPVDCASLPETLFANELFGHERGAFTDALETKKGLFALAEGGTLFLDEVESLTSGPQGAFLRLLENRSWRPLGSPTFQPIKCRIIAATNQDLHQLVLAKTFRADLYYRLAVNVISIPPLRERREDIPLLCQHFLNKYGQTFHKDGIYLAREAMEILSSYKYPGNVRELQNILQQAIVRISGPCINARDLLLSSEEIKISPDCSWSDARRHALSAWEKDFLTLKLSAYSGNVSKIARELRLSRQVLYRLLKCHNLLIPHQPKKVSSQSRL